jgi:NhaA family Na+:H+ antiporter
MNTTQSESSFITEFLRSESAGGVLLMGAAVLAIVLANSPLAHYYDLLIDVPVIVKVGALGLDKPLLLWVNDGLMAVFFLLVGLELKRELIEGELSDKRNIILPGLGAVGGMAAPAMIYLFLNGDDPIASQGWAIPAATDIAFALGILSLLGPRVPTSLKIFLTSLAIFDDIGAIIIIAFFYTSKISMTALIVAGSCTALLAYLNWRGVTAKSIYLTIGAVMWFSMVKSGVHATLAGVVLAMFIPLHSDIEEEGSPLKTLEHDLHHLVAFFVLPVFAFCNAGINLSGVGLEEMTHDVPLGIALGLFVGKQIGVFGFCALAILLGLAKMPKDMSWVSLYGTSALCGIGFTMSLFVGSLAFEETGVNLMFDERLGIIVGSLASGLVGFFFIRMALSDKVAAK